MTNDEAEALKVGDMVLCVSDSHAVGFIVGDKYEIVGISENGNPYVHLPDGDPWYLTPNCGFRDDFEVVREQDAKAAYPDKRIVKI